MTSIGWLRPFASRPAKLPLRHFQPPPSSSGLVPESSRPKNAPAATRTRARTHQPRVHPPRARGAPAAHPELGRFPMPARPSAAGPAAAIRGCARRNVQRATPHLLVIPSASISARRAAFWPGVRMMGREPPLLPQVLTAVSKSCRRAVCACRAVLARGRCVRQCLPWHQPHGVSRAVRLHGHTRPVRGARCAAPYNQAGPPAGVGSSTMWQHQGDVHKSGGGVGRGRGSLLPPRRHCTLCRAAPCTAPCGAVRRPWMRVARGGCPRHHTHGQRFGCRRKGWRVAAGARDALPHLLGRRGRARLLVHFAVPHDAVFFDKHDGGHFGCSSQQPAAAAEGRGPGMEGAGREQDGGPHAWRRLPHQASGSHHDAERLAPASTPVLGGVAEPLLSAKGVAPRCWWLRDSPIGRSPAARQRRCCEAQPSTRMLAPRSEVPSEFAMEHSHATFVFFDRVP